MATKAACIHVQIKEFVMQMLLELADGKLPSVSIAKYQVRPCLPADLRSGIYERSTNQEILGLNRIAGVQRLVVMLRVLGIIHQLLEQGKHASKRDIYYMDPSVFKDATAVDQAINDICIRFSCRRSSLHVVSVSKGLVMGWLSYMEDDRRVDCMKYSCTGFPIPVHTNFVKDIRSRAEYILLVEKETVFQRLANDGFCAKNRCILLSGKGYPDVATRSFLRLLRDELELPVFGLVDGDPHGFDILLTYKFGSLTMAYDSEALSTPEIQWLGVFLVDTETFGIPQNCLLPLSTNERQKGNAILNRSYVRECVPLWRSEDALEGGPWFQVWS